MECMAICLAAHGRPNTMGTHTLFPRPDHIGLTDELTTDAKALPIVKEMGAHKCTGLACTAQAHFEKATGRTLAASADDVDQL